MDATGWVLLIALLTLLAGIVSNLIAFRTFREARSATGAQLETLVEQRQATAAQRATLEEQRQTTNLGREAVAEAQRATRIAVNARREEQLGRRSERLMQVGDYLGELSHATVLYPVAARAHACSVAIDRLRVSLASLTDLDLPQTATLARFRVAEGDAQNYPRVPTAESCTTALTEVQGIAAEVRDELQAIQRDNPT